MRPLQQFALLFGLIALCASLGGLNENQRRTNTRLDSLCRAQGYVRDYDDLPQVNNSLQRKPGTDNIEL